MTQESRQHRLQISGDKGHGQRPGSEPVLSEKMNLTRARRGTFWSHIRRDVMV